MSTAVVIIRKNTPAPTTREYATGGLVSTARRGIATFFAFFLGLGRSQSEMAVSFVANVIAYFHVCAVKGADGRLPFRDSFHVACTRRFFVCG
jgi:hypothetical protein